MQTESNRRPPPAAVLRAFGAADAPVLLPGGQGAAWRAGPLVLKAVTLPEEARWRAGVLADLADSDLFRVARPAPAPDGGWVVQGWEACRFVPGETSVRRPDDVLRAGIAFHAAVADRPRPAFLDLRADPWAFGDRVAWEELPPRAGPAALGLLEPLLRSRRPVDLPAQAVHGDLAGNVLFAPGRPPAIIDWSVYWRPESWASAVVVADALCWHGAGPDLAAHWAHRPAWGQMLVRALIYRIVTHDAAAGPGGVPAERLRAYRTAIGLAVACAEREVSGGGAAPGTT